VGNTGKWQEIQGSYGILQELAGIEAVFMTTEIAITFVR
jgi:hypothetical protein